MSSATAPFSSKELTILAVGESAEDKAAVLDGLQRASSANMQDTSIDGSRELRYAGADGLAWRILDPGDGNLTPSDAAAIMFVVDVANYDQATSPLSPTVRRLQTSLARFAAVANAAQYARTPVLLLFRGADAMAAKLPSSPLEGLFPDYDPSQDPAAVNSAAMMGVSFLASKFAQESPREHDQVYAHPVAGPEAGTRELEFVMKALEDVVEKGEKAS
ncbi:guanine nucleotide-binding protein subunit alpha [Xylographa bjoerkii]|nr:guanine nucleotide-binding protein subunit alpha [Xylographa bjoerkii]